MEETWFLPSARSKRAARGVFLRHSELNVGDKRSVPGDTLSHHDHGGDRESRNVR